MSGGCGRKGELSEDKGTCGGLDVVEGAFGRVMAEPSSNFMGEPSNHLLANRAVYSVLRIVKRWLPTIKRNPEALEYRHGCRKVTLVRLAAFHTLPLPSVLCLQCTPCNLPCERYQQIMGLFSASPSSPSPATPAPSTDGAYIAPNRNARAHCWAARDNFFACLERNNIVDSIKEKEKAESACAMEDIEFGKECAKSWVSLKTSSMGLRTRMDLREERRTRTDHVTGYVFQTEKSDGAQQSADFGEVEERGRKAHA